ncbi:hypothetical protein SEA_SCOOBYDOOBYDOO_212 [Mycobacterium phage ScoobyDoobyDoo]|nr:hypothetical protein SEA_SCOOBYDOOBYDOO_212 [Mycobacterium phage ScoobyDoobyDoo]
MDGHRSDHVLVDEWQGEYWWRERAEDRQPSRIDILKTHQQADAVCAARFKE